MGVVSGAPNRGEGLALRLYLGRFHLVAITTEYSTQFLFLALRLGMYSKLRPREIAPVVSRAAVMREVAGLAPYDLEGDKITALRLYIPMDVFMRQLGALPAEPVGAAT